MRTSQYLSMFASASRLAATCEEFRLDTPSVPPVALHRNLQYVGFTCFRRWYAELGTDVEGALDVDLAGAVMVRWVPDAEVQGPLDGIDIVVDTRDGVVLVRGGDGDGQVELDTLLGGRNGHGAGGEQQKNFQGRHFGELQFFLIS